MSEVFLVAGRMELNRVPLQTGGLDILLCKHPSPMQTVSSLSFEYVPSLP